ncbi:MAG TPA: hypothetical protein VF391_03620 [Dermatophilaceae bacterium]
MRTYRARWSSRHGLCLLDLAGVATAGTATDMSKIMCNHAAENFGSSTRTARLLFDGRRASPVGAAMVDPSNKKRFDVRGRRLVPRPKECPGRPLVCT